MNSRFNLVIGCLLLMGVVLVFSGCGGEAPRAELDISNIEYSIVEESKRVYSVKANGTIRNVGNVDLRDVVVTGNCSSCVPAFRQQTWYLTKVDQKTDDQKDLIRFLGKGERANFEFKGLAYFGTVGGDIPTVLPDGLEVSVLSYEIGK
jgi:hypothetical protein